MSPVPPVAEAGRRKAALPKLSDAVQGAAIQSMGRIAAARDQVSQAKRDRSVNQRRAATEAAELARLQAEETEDLVQELVGEGASEADAARQRRIAELLKSVPAMQAADDVFAERVSEKAAEIESLTTPHAAVMVDVVRAIQDPALAAVRTALEELRPHLIALVASDMIRQRLIGDGFFLPAGATPPFAGETVVRKFLTALPVRLRSAGLDLSSIRLAAGNTATRIVASIEEKAQ